MILAGCCSNNASRVEESVFADPALDLVEPSNLPESGEVIDVDHILPESSEESCLLREWIQEEGVASAAQEALIRTGRDLYLVFNREFTATFYGDDAPGIGFVREVLKRRFGRLSVGLLDAALDRIRDRRLHLLRAFKRKYQPKLSAAWNVEPDLLPQYFRRVASLETLRLPEADLPWLNYPLDLNVSGFVSSPRSGGEMSPKSDPAPGHFLADLLSEWWSRKNGFTRQQQLEGLVSHGLGSHTGSEILEQRVRRFFSERREAWQQNYNRLIARASRLLLKLDRIRSSGQSSNSDRIEEQLLGQELELAAKLEKLKSAIDVHWSKYLPKPAEVNELLRGFDVPCVSSTRFRRIDREIAILRERLEKTFKSVALPDLEFRQVQLVLDLKEHVGRWPVGARPQGEARVSRAQRQTKRKRWKREGERLLQRIDTECNRRTIPPQRITDLRFREFLFVAQDLYQLGIVNRAGISAALRRYSGPRLSNLLRTE